MRQLRPATTPSRAERRAARLALAARRELQRQATRRARRRGHVLGRFSTGDRTCQAGIYFHAFCAHCSCGVVINVVEQKAKGTALAGRCGER